MKKQKKQALNPYLPSWEYIPDGEPYVFDGRVEKTKKTSIKSLSTVLGVYSGWRTIRF